MECFTPIASSLSVLTTWTDSLPVGVSLSIFTSFPLICYSYSWLLLKYDSYKLDVFNTDKHGSRVYGNLEQSK